MVYNPTKPSGIESVEELRLHVDRELENIARAMSEMTVLELRTVHQEPEKPREGMIVSADGTDWNPGAGIGIYAYVGGAWVKLS